MIGYHFTGSRLRDGRPIPPIGEWLTHDGPVIACESGLHASEHPFDALTYAPGCMLHIVELEGDLIPHGNPVDKWVGRRRRIIASIDATQLLREYARWCALEVIDLWDAPPVVREFLVTGNEELQAAARAAAVAAAARPAAVAAAAARPAAWAAAAARAAAARPDAWAADAWAAAARPYAWAAAAQRRRFAEMVNAAFKEVGARTG